MLQREEREETRLARAYVKVNVAAGKEHVVKESLLRREEVQTADITSGDQDIIALVSAASFDELLDLMRRKVEGLRRKTQG